jgi:hypothetical protein
VTAIELVARIARPGQSSYGLPWGQDRLVAIFLATVANPSALAPDHVQQRAETLGLQLDGSQYRRLMASFQRIFGVTIFFGTDRQLERAEGSTKLDSFS